MSYNGSSYVQTLAASDLSASGSEVRVPSSLFFKSGNFINGSTGTTYAAGSLKLNPGGNSKGTVTINAGVGPTGGGDIVMQTAGGTLTYTGSGALNINNVSGTAGQVLTSDAAGKPSWKAAGAAVSPYVYYQFGAF
jgi:hypothetical protein